MPFDVGKSDQLATESVAPLAILFCSLQRPLSRLQIKRDIAPLNTSYSTAKLHSQVVSWGFIVIFDDLVPRKNVWPTEAHWPRRRADALIKRFEAAFPDIHYDLYWETRLLNAQAFISERGRCVRLYGGLGRHRKVGIEGLAFALAHETGHHLGGPPRHPYYASLSSERRASEWALTTGLANVFGFAVGQRYAHHGLRQLAGLWPRHVLDPEPFDVCSDLIDAFQK